MAAVLCGLIDLFVSQPNQGGILAMLRCCNHILLRTQVLALLPNAFSPKSEVITTHTMKSVIPRSPGCLEWFQLSCFLRKT